MSHVKVDGKEKVLVATDDRRIALHCKRNELFDYIKTLQNWN